MTGRIRWMPEVHCACGACESLNAEGGGDAIATREARRIGWEIGPPRHGWMCPKCIAALNERQRAAVVLLRANDP